jgi:hypothetical protein
MIKTCCNNLFIKTITFKVYFVENVLMQHFIKNHFVEIPKLIKNKCWLLMNHFVETTYGIFYLWCPKLQGLKRGPGSVRGWNNVLRSGEVLGYLPYVILMN